MIIALKAFGLWFLLLIIAIANAAGREKIINPRCSEHAGHVISSFTLSAFIFLLCLALIHVIGLSSARQYLILGGCWVVMTVAFEFLFGHFFMGHPWSRLFNDYNIFAGRVWLLVLVSTLFSPYLAARIRGLF